MTAASACWKAHEPAVVLRLFETLDSEGARNDVFQEVHQIRIHELILVWNAENHHSFAPKEGSELLRDPVRVMPLHSYDDVGPLDEIPRYRSIGIAVGAGAQGSYIRMVCEELVRRWAPEPVLTAYEENVHWVVLGYPAQG